MKHPTFLGGSAMFRTTVASAPQNNHLLSRRQLGPSRWLSSNRPLASGCACGNGSPRLVPRCEGRSRSELLSCSSRRRRSSIAWRRRRRARVSREKPEASGLADARNRSELRAGQSFPVSRGRHVAGLERTLDWYLNNEDWWRALQDRSGLGKRLGRTRKDPKVN